MQLTLLLPQKTSLDIVSRYDLRKVHVRYIYEDGTSSYMPRSIPKKAALLRGRLLTCATQKKQTTGLAKFTISSRTALSPLTSKQTKRHKLL
jgi:hypothetical protein